MHISNITLRANMGYVMTFDVSYNDIGIRIHQVCLMRPDSAPDELWLYYPTSERAVVSMTRAAKRKVGVAAADMYNKLRGTNLKFTLPPLADEPVINAGLKRILRISAEEEETLAKAGV